MYTYFIHIEFAEIAKTVFFASINEDSEGDHQLMMCSTIVAKYFPKKASCSTVVAQLSEAFQNELVHNVMYLKLRLLLINRFQVHLDFPCSAVAQFFDLGGGNRYVQLERGQNQKHFSELLSQIIVLQCYIFSKYNHISLFITIFW